MFKMKTDYKIEDKCFYHSESRRQRKIECDEGLPKLVSNNFKKIGCFKCTGYNFKCEYYLSNKNANKPMKEEFDRKW